MGEPLECEGRTLTSVRADSLVVGDHVQMPDLSFYTVLRLLKPNYGVWVDLKGGGFASWQAPDEEVVAIVKSETLTKKSTFVAGQDAAGEGARAIKALEWLGRSGGICSAVGTSSFFVGCWRGSTFYHATGDSPLLAIEAAMAAEGTGKL